MTSDVDLQLARAETMGRIAVVTMTSRTIIEMADDVVAMCLDPSEDPKGKKREEMLHAIDEAAGEIAGAVQAAQTAFAESDPAMGEDEDDDESDDDDD